MLGADKAPVTIIEYASMTCPHCAHFPETTLPGAEEALHRHRQGALHLARIPARPAGRRRLHAGALRRQRTNTCRWSRRCSPSRPTGRCRSRSQPLKAIAKQAGFTEAVLRRLPGESEGARRHPGGARPRRRTSSASTRRRPSSSTARSFVGDLSIEAIGQGDRPLSQGRIRVFRRRRGLAERPSRRRRPDAGVGEGLDNASRPVALGAATIHSPRRCGTHSRACAGR